MRERIKGRPSVTVSLLPIRLHSSVQCLKGLKRSFFFFRFLFLLGQRRRSGLASGKSTDAKWRCKYPSLSLTLLTHIGTETIDGEKKEFAFPQSRVFAVRNCHRNWAMFYGASVVPILFFVCVLTQIYAFSTRYFASYVRRNLLSGFIDSVLRSESDCQFANHTLRGFFARFPSERKKGQKNIAL